jgi:hypothetical protein
MEAPVLSLRLCSRTKPASIRRRRDETLLDHRETACCCAVPATRKACCSKPMALYTNNDTQSLQCSHPSSHRKTWERGGRNPNPPSTDDPDLLLFPPLWWGVCAVASVRGRGPGRYKNLLENAISRKCQYSSCLFLNACTRGGTHPFPPPPNKINHKFQPALLRFFQKRLGEKRWL